MGLAVQEPDSKQRDRAGFDCGVEVLNRYLKGLATQHRAKDIATTFVLIDTDHPARILGYYALSAATSRPNRSIGGSSLGVYAVVVEAKDAATQPFYRKFGLRLCDTQTRQLYLPLGAA